jgi:hypothetical protein
MIVVSCGRHEGTSGVSTCAAVGSEVAVGPLAGELVGVARAGDDGDALGGDVAAAPVADPAGDAAGAHAAAKTRTARSDVERLTVGSG